MPLIRHPARLARLLLAWYTLAVAAAVASPLVQGRALELVCSGGQFRLVAVDDDPAPAQVLPALDCPLCLPASAPPPAGPTPLPALTPAGAAPQAHPPDHPVVRTAAPPLPARGPPRIA